jgi:hypothetical protein
MRRATRWLAAALMIGLAAPDVAHQGPAADFPVATLQSANGNGNGNGNVGNLNGNGNQGNFNGNGNLGSGNGNGNTTNGNGNFNTGNGAGNGNRTMRLSPRHEKSNML